MEIGKINGALKRPINLTRQFGGQLLDFTRQGRIVSAYGGKAGCFLSPVYIVRWGRRPTRGRMIKGMLLLITLF